MAHNQVRNLEDDLAICEAATPGPWMTKTNPYSDLLIEGDGQILGFLVSDEDQAFVIAAREGWPNVIRLAQQLEREVELLKNELQVYRNRERGPWD